MNKPWVKYKCGCKEGLGVSLNSKCRDHKKKVIAYSNEITLGLPKVWTYIFEPRKSPNPKKGV